VRILHVIQELRTGGAERIVIELARGAREAGHDVAVAAAPGSLAEEVGVPTFPMPLVGRRLGRVPGAAMSLERAMRQARPDVIHVHNPGMAAVAAVPTIRGRRVRALVTVHGVPDGDYAAASRVLRAAGLPVVACGPGVAAGLEEHRCPVTATIVNAVRPPARPADAGVLRQEWGFAEGEPLIVSVGRLVPQKNHALAIRALACVPRGVLAILGEGPDLYELRSVVEAERLVDRVAFAGLRGDATAVIGAADVVVLPSRGEGLPLVGLEALAAGTPFVAAAVRGVRELLTDGENALLVAPDDPKALAAAIGRVLDDDDLRQRLRAGGLRLVAAHGTGAMVDAYLRLYERVAR
jgi:glycosyltransferase involved in cell wall biosynthesis